MSAGHRKTNITISYIKKEVISIDEHDSKHFADIRTNNHTLYSLPQRIRRVHQRCLDGFISNGNHSYRKRDQNSYNNNPGRVRKNIEDAIKDFANSL